MKYYKDGKEVKRANTISQRLKLLNNNTSDTYKILEHPYYGYAILKNGEKIFGTLIKYQYEAMLGRLCYNEHLTDVYNNILV